MGMVPSLLQFTTCIKGIGLAIDHTPPCHLVSVSIQIVRTRIRLDPPSLTDTIHKKVIFSFKLYPALCWCAGLIVVFQDALHLFPPIQSALHPAVRAGARMSRFVKAVLHTIQCEPAGIQLSGLWLKVVVFSVHLGFTPGDFSILVSIADIAILFDPADLQKMIAAKVVETMVDLIQALHACASGRRNKIAVQAFSLPPHSLAPDYLVDTESSPRNQTQAHQYHTGNLQRRSLSPSSCVLCHTKLISLDFLAFHSHLSI